VSISWHCACGKSLKAPDGSEGKRARCPACGAINHVPAPAPLEPVVAAPQAVSEDPFANDDPFDPYQLAEAPAPVPTRQPVATEAVTPPAYHRRAPADEGEDDELPLAQGEGRTWRDLTYLVLLLAMLPLVFSSFKKDDGTIIDRVEHTLAAHPEVRDRFDTVAQSETAGMDEMIEVFPGHMLEGALLPRDTAMHWAFAAMSAGLFLTLLMFLFKPGSAKPRSLLLTGLFTGTVGIVLLLAFQFIANIATAMGFRGMPHGKAAIIFLIIKLIGYSYRAAEDPTNGIFLSFVGFTFGVGLCEELCKSLPLVKLIRDPSESVKWRGACLWGLASGVGFGVAEGVMYSSRYYNGVLGADMYLVRFLSCVALHAVWTASTGIMLYRNRYTIGSAEGAWGTVGYMIIFMAPSMILHGLYDTLLKKDHGLIALGVAIASFVYLAGLIEWSLRKGAYAEPVAKPAYQLPGRHTAR
jgi:RsiW-degrading membrane proteinase PrsW (M82 family)